MTRNNLSHFILMCKIPTFHNLYAWLMKWYSVQRNASTKWRARPYATLHTGSPPPSLGFHCLCSTYLAFSVTFNNNSLCVSHLKMKLNQCLYGKKNQAWIKQVCFSQIPKSLGVKCILKKEFKCVSCTIPKPWVWLHRIGVQFKTSLTHA